MSIYFAHQVFEDLGMLGKFTRFAGTSGGAIIATLAAIGVSASAIMTILDTDLKEIYIGKLQSNKYVEVSVYNIE
jgi:predicted acylesterase/phospholipase RssA